MIHVRGMATVRIVMWQPGPATGEVLRQRSELKRCLSAAQIGDVSVASEREVELVLNVCVKNGVIAREQITAVLNSVGVERAQVQPGEEVAVEVRYDGDGFPSKADMALRKTLEAAIAAAGISELIDAGAGGGVMDLNVFVWDAAIAAPQISAIVTRLDLDERASVWIVCKTT
jgi:hypothetical protein